MQKHFDLLITSIHFHQWKTLFIGTIDELFAGKIADEAKARASSISVTMQVKISSVS